MLDSSINEHTFITTAMRFYDNPQCLSTKEFEEDLRRFSYLKKLFARYIDDGDLKEKLIINHLVTIHNLFGVAATELLFYKIEQRYWQLLITFLTFLDRMPDQVPDFHINNQTLQPDQSLLEIIEQSVGPVYGKLHN